LLSFLIIFLHNEKVKKSLNKLKKIKSLENQKKQKNASQFSNRLAKFYKKLVT